MPRAPFWSGLATCLMLCGGCATYEDRALVIRRAFYDNNLVAAANRIDEGLQKPKRDVEVLKLESAIVDLSAGRPEVAEKTLREVRDKFDFYEQPSAGETALSMLTDANRKAYAGEDYERVLIRVMLAMSNLMHDGGDAVPYSLQAVDKQRQIIQAGVDKDGQNLKASYRQVAIGPYLHAALSEATHVNYDDAERAHATIASWEPDFPYAVEDLERTRHGRHSQPGHGVLYVLTLVGRGPFKYESEEIPSTVAMLIADRIISHNADQTLTPTIAPIKVPRVALSPNTVRKVGVAVDGVDMGTTETITDVGRMAVEQAAAEFPQVLAEAVVRRAVKKAALYGTKQALGGEKYSLGNVALDVAGVVWEATEAADTRCWGLLPDKIQVLRLELPAGEHQLGLHAIASQGAEGPEESALIAIEDGRNTYVLANFPEMRLVGKILAK